MTAITQAKPATEQVVVRPRRRRWPLAVLAATTLATTAYMLSAYVPPEMSTSRIPVTGSVHFVVLVAHIFTAAIATVTGLAQLWPWLRSRHPKLHRWTGRAYFFLGVFPSAVLAIPVAALAPFGAANQAALFTLDILWLATGIAGYRTARRRRFADHRRWMIRNYALTFSSIATRFFVPVLALAIVPQADGPAYQGNETAIGHDIASGSAWLGLVITMIATEWHLHRRH